MEGGTIYLKYPKDLQIPNNAVQQIQISHNFTESYIISEELDWYSVSFYNSEKELIIVIVLEKHEDGKDYIIVLEEFNKELDLYLTVEEELKAHLENMFNLSLHVFKAREAVIIKLSQELAEVKMRNYFLEKRFGKVLNSDYLKEPKNIILYLLSIHDGLNFEGLKEYVKINENQLKVVINTLINDKIIEYSEKNNLYFLKF